MPFFAAYISRRGKIYWYDFLILALAAAIVYPDNILDWLSTKTGKTFGWLQLILFEIFATGIMILTMIILMPIYPKLQWWHPIFMVGLLAILRLVMYGVTRFFGFDD